MKTTVSLIYSLLWITGEVLLLPLTEIQPQILLLPYTELFCCVGILFSVCLKMMNGGKSSLRTYSGIHVFAIHTRGYCSFSFQLDISKGFRKVFLGKWLDFLSRILREITFEFKNWLLFLHSQLCGICKEENS